jgi:hypothetical protein
MMFTPMSIGEKAHFTFFSWFDPKSVFFHPSGWEYNSRTGWTDSSSCGFVHITAHPCKPFIVITGSNGRVWIGKVGDPTNLFLLIHQPNSDDSQCATTCAFHPFENYVAVGVPGNVLIYEISSSSLYLSCKLLMNMSFFQNPGYFCTRPPKYAPCEIEWNPTGESLTAVSEEDGKLSKKFTFSLEPFKVENEMLHGYMCSFNEGKISPVCSSISSDGTSVATGYSGGRISITHDMNNVMKVLPNVNSIKKIKFDPHNPKILAIKIKMSSMGRNAVHILGISSNGKSIEILHSFPDAISFCFYAGMFILQYGQMITFFRLNGDNFPVKMGEFTSKVGHIQSFCLTTLKDVITLWYSSHCDSNLHEAKLAFQ